MVQQAQKTKSLFPQGDQAQLVPQPAPKATVNMIYGGNGGAFQFVPGQTVKEVLSTSEIRDACGYSNLSEDNTHVILDGEEIARANWDRVVVKDGQQLEVLKKAGQKAA